LLWQYEMALELFDFGQHTIVPLLVGRNTQKFGRNDFEDFDEFEKHLEFWPSEVPDLTVTSILKDALAGLRCRSEVSSRLDDKTLDGVEGIPSIIQGRTIKQTINAFSSSKIFTSWKFVGPESLALNDICTKLKELAQRVPERSHQAKRALEGEGSAEPLSKDSDVGAFYSMRKEETGEGQHDVLEKRGVNTQYRVGGSLLSGGKRQRSDVASSSEKGQTFGSASASSAGNVVSGLDYVCVCMCVCAHACVCVCVSTNPHPTLPPLAID